MATQTRSTTDPAKDESSSALVLFGEALPASMPTALAEAIKKNGLATRTLSGFAPLWKPAKEGDSIMGVCSGLRLNAGKYKDGKYGGSVLTLNGPQGEAAVFLGADLATKFGYDPVTKDFRDSPIGRFYYIRFLGLRKVEGQANPMKEYLVQEVMPPKSEG
jgi:hypothetical protein